MRIGIDIDDTLVGTTESFDRLIKKYNINFSKKWGENWTEEERCFIFNKYLYEILINSKLKENAKQVIDYLVSLGHELFIITARNNKYCSKIEKMTKEFIKREELNIKDIYFCQNKKSDLAKKINIDLMIDDSIFVCNNMENACIDYIQFGNKIKTWDQVLEYIMQKEE